MIPLLTKVVIFPVVGTFGNSSRRFFYGPGINNYDMGSAQKPPASRNPPHWNSVLKTFNTFNHAQFDGANAVDGNRDDATFGQI